MGDFPGNPARQLAAAWQAATAALGEWRDPGFAATPEGQGEIGPGATGAVRAAFAGNWGACQCLCATAHPQDKGVCDGGAILTRRLDGVDVPLCAPCAVAQGVAERRK